MASLVCLHPADVTARVRHVPSEYPTIAAGIAAAFFGDTVAVACGTYQEHDLAMKSGVTLRSVTGEAGCVVIDAGGLGRVLTCTGVGATTRIEGLTIRGGLTHNPIGSPGGGGLLLAAGSAPQITRCIFESNQAPAGAGGALACYQSYPRLADCVLRENTATDAGVYCKETSAVFDRCSFLENTGSEFGGGLRSDGSALTFSACEFTGNFGAVDGGGLVLALSSTAAITDCVFSGNSAYRGGGMCAEYAVATISNTRFVDNRAFDGEAWGEGGGLYCHSQYTSATVVGCSFEGNEASFGGGGVVRNLAHGSFERCQFAEHDVNGKGGALEFSNDADATVKNCTFVRNGAQYGGGAIDVYNCSPIVENCILAFGTRGSVVSCQGTLYGSPQVTCCDLYGNPGDDWDWGCMSGQDGVNGNFSADPLFCGLDTGDFTIDANSPCLPGHHPHGDDCGLIGAFGQGCDAVAVEPVTWGSVKARFYRR